MFVILKYQPIGKWLNHDSWKIESVFDVGKSSSRKKEKSKILISQLVGLDD